MQNFFFYFQDPSNHHKIDLWTDLDFLLGQMFLPGAKNLNANRPYEVWKFHFYPTKSAPVSRNHDFVLIMLTKIFVKALAVYGAHKKWMDEILLAFGQILTSFIQNKNLICLNSTAHFQRLSLFLSELRWDVRGQKFFAQNQYGPNCIGSTIVNESLRIKRLQALFSAVKGG